MFFWTLAMLAQLNIDQFAAEGSDGIKQTQVSLLLGSLIVGVGLGSVLAGIWSGGKVELGILPLGAGGLAIFSFLLYTVEGVLVDPSGDYTLQLHRGLRISVDAGHQRRACSTCRWPRSCRTAARPSIAARSWRPAIFSRSAAC